MTLPPLLPMSKAPRDGTEVLALMKDGRTVAIEWMPGVRQWVLAGRYFGDEFNDVQLRGWWPMPSVEGE